MPASLSRHLAVRCSRRPRSRCVLPASAVGTPRVTQRARGRSLLPSRAPLGRRSFVAAARPPHAAHVLAAEGMRWHCHPAALTGPSLRPRGVSSAFPVRRACCGSAGEPALSEATLAAIDDVARALSGARRVLFITGAGVSAESGLATYRGPGGLYDDDRPTEDGVRVEVGLGVTHVAHPRRVARAVPLAAFLTAWLLPLVRCLPVRVQHALSIDMLRTRPALTWKYLREIEAGCRGATPNAAHHAIAQLQQHEALGQGVWVLTQNVDGLHRAAYVCHAD